MGWLVGCLLAWLLSCLVAWFFGWLVGWLIGWLGLGGCLVGRWVGGLIGDWLSGRILCCKFFSWFGDDF